MNPGKSRRLAYAIQSSPAHETSLRLVRVALSAAELRYDGLERTFVEELVNYRLIVTACLERHMGLGRLHIPDVILAAHQFVNLTRGGFLDLCMTTSSSEELRQERVRMSRLSRVVDANAEAARLSQALYQPEGTSSLDVSGRRTISVRRAGRTHSVLGK